MTGEENIEHNEMELDLFENEYKKYCLELKLSHVFNTKLKPFMKPRLSQAIKLLGVAYRTALYEKKIKENNRIPFIDFFSPVKLKQIYGVPLGGIGTGTIGRSYTGEFTRYQLVPGIYEHETCEANLFTVNIRKKNHTVYQQTLCTKRSKQRGLRGWNMGYCGDHATYYALYPESWTVYDLPGQHVRLTCHQLSPVIPHNYKDSSLPVGLFDWTVENKNKEDIELSLMFTWQSGSCSDKFELTDVTSHSFKNYTNFNTSISGCVINQKLKNIPLEYCIAAKNSDNLTITYNCQFYTDDEKSSNDVWQDLLNDGNLDNIEFESLKTISKSRKLTIAVCVKALIKSQSKESIEFSLVWHMPNINFGSDVKKYYKRFYTRYFPESPTSSLDISCYSLSQRINWLRQLFTWRIPILHNEKTPIIYKNCLFNELYFISDGGTLWMNIEDKEEDNPLVNEYGRFAYLEGHEYRMYNTYDVHFYASFALLKLWPKLQLSLQYDFAKTINSECKSPRKFLFDGANGQRKTMGTIPHDIGDPDDRPWDNLNAYVIHDPKDWKDLNLKFVLTVYRDYSYLKDLDYLKYMWPYIKLLMITVQSQDHDGDGLIDSEGLPDQTYDAWYVTGASAYCGGLHVAALSCICEIAKILKDDESLEKYSSILTRAKKAYNDKLWNGKYYKYDCSNSNYNDSIMTDMCCGHWYLRCSGFKHEVFEKEKIQSCLQTIYENNVIKFCDGKRGAVNGMRPNGKIDTTSLQSEEMWTGVTNAFNSLLVFEGMHEKAWGILSDLYKSMYYELGLAFQTPEALNKKNEYRSLGYMRPLSIWSIEYALEMTQ